MKSLLSLIACVLLASHVLADSEDEKRNLFFENNIRPLLVEHCYECHSAEAETSEGGLLLDHKTGWKTGGDSGPTIVPGDPDGSLLMEAVSYRNVDLQMPPEGKLSEAQIDLLRQWIQQGAYDPRDAAPTVANPTETFDLQARRQQHWCWQPLSAVTLPQTGEDWARKDVDRFIFEKLAEQGLTPAAPAAKRTWLRRVTFATIGLPPTPEEIHDFINDDATDAQQKVLDRLLQSPHFGEHWGQHWLDLMRFAETRGHEQDFAIPEAYRYRDYVIRAFNADVPYDQLVTEHIAGDLVQPPRTDPDDRTNQSIQGTGFWQLHDATHSPVDICGDEALRMQNQIDVFSRAFLGLSLGCARCHDHKFDAIATRDYYAMYGFLQSSSYYLADVADPERQADVVQRLTHLNESTTPQLRNLLAQQLVAQFSELPKYLKAASDFDSKLTTPEDIHHWAQQRAAEDAQGEDPLDEETLENLVNYLRGEVPLASPLKSWAVSLQDGIAHDQAQTQVAQLRQAASAQDDAAWAKLKVTRSVKDGERNYQPQDRPWSPEEVIEDYSTAEYPHWITAGHRFGDAPVSVGTLLWSDHVPDDASRPAFWFADQTLASSETRSSKLTGLLRTRTFEVTADQIWYRYRGNGKLFLAVDSHRVVAGPLHGAVKKDLKDDSRQWTWVSQNVRDYVGHRVHVEFTGGPDFAIDKMVFAGSQPPSEFPRLTSIPDTEAIAALAERLQRNALTATDARFLNWWLEHAELVPPSPQDAAITEAVASYRKAQAAIEAELPTPVYALSLLDGSGENEPIHIRGNHRNRTQEAIQRNMLAALGTMDTEAEQGSGRLTLAKRLVAPENPLLARVYVNRIWHHLFGRGIVESVDDFGVMGKAPTHPELLDYLALQFMQNGWSTKWLIRELLLSSTYGMSSHPDAEQEARDPANLYWHRMPVRRLTGEVIRDHLLAVSGRLDRTQFGKSVAVHITPFMRGNRTPKHSGPFDGDGRRSIYTEVRRNHLPAFLAAFDKPPPFMAIGRRTISNSPTQSLILLNDPLVHEQASLWAKQLLQVDAERRLELAYEQAFSRQPTAQEVQVATEFLRQQEAYYAGETATDATAIELAWRDLCHTLFNVKEFIHVN